MNRLALTPQLEYQLTVLNGPDKGAVYRLVAKRVTIGRGAECDIVIKDDAKVSRVHAQIDVNDGEARISDMSDRNKIIVNGDDSPKQILQHKAVIQLGKTQLQFRLSDAAKSSGAGIQAISPRNELNVAANFLKEKAAGFNRKVRRGNGRQSLMPMIAIVVLIGGFGYYATHKSAAPVAVKKAGGEDEILRQTASVDEELAAMAAEKTSSGEESDAYKQAQSHFVKGFRDYNNGQYERATESFKACLALAPSHSGCLQHKNDAERKWSQVINDQIILGLRNKSQNQYAACAAAFKNVIFAVKVPSDARYREAESNLRFCEAKQGSRF